MGAFPIAGDIVGALQNKANCEAWELNTLMLNNNQDKNECFDFEVIVNPNNVLDIYYVARDMDGFIRYTTN